MYMFLLTSSYSWSANLSISYWVSLRQTNKQTSNEPKERSQILYTELVSAVFIFSAFCDLRLNLDSGMILD